MVAGVVTPESAASGCQWPLASRKTSHPAIGAPNVRHVSPAGHGVALQSCVDVLEQRCRAAATGWTGLSGFRISIAVTVTRTRAIGVGSLSQRAKIVFPTRLGSMPAIGVV